MRWLLRFRKLDMSLKDQRQALVDTFINAIYLYDDKVLITFNYKEGTQTVTFEEAAEAASKGNGSDLDCFTAQKKKRHTNAYSPVDIPTGWEPRTKQQPTGLIAYPAAQGRAVQVLLSAQKKKRHTNVCLFLVRVVIQHFLKTIVVQFVFEVIG